jgi:hypothetical protein
MIETTLRATSEKLKPGACSTFGAPRNSSAQKIAKNRSIAATCARLQAARDLTALLLDGERVARVVEACAQPRQPLVAHQHQVALLGLMAGRSGVETGRPVLDGVEAIGRQGVLDRKRRARERLRGKPLDRITVDGVDLCIFGGHRSAC